MSKTLYTRGSFTNHDILSQAVLAMGGTVLGLGRHQLYTGIETGFGIKLPRWRYPLVIKSDGSIAYDDYMGSWGNVEDIESLKGHYALAAAAAAADQQGWQREAVFRNEEGEQSSEKLVIYHPSGGTITVTPDGKIDADCFTGMDCHDATSVIAKMMGTVTESHTKPAYYQEYAKVVSHE